GTFQLYDPSPSLSIEISTFVNIPADSVTFRQQRRSAHLNFPTPRRENIPGPVGAAPTRPPVLPGTHECRVPQRSCQPESPYKTPAMTGLPRLQADGASRTTRRTAFRPTSRRRSGRLKSTRVVTDVTFS